MKSVHLLSVFLSIFIFSTVHAFECYTCNTESYRTGPCIDRKTVCENSTSCSMAVTYRNGRAITRKFCTPPNTPIYQYLMLLPGASMCQNVDFLPPIDYITRRKRAAGPPGVISEQASLLCVCSTPLCNRGTYSKVLENTMLNNLPKRLLPPMPSFEKELKSQQENKLFDSDDEDNMEQQMAQAGF